MKELNHMLIKTSIDELIRLIGQKKKLTVRKAASLLKVNESQVESWVKVLENSGYVELMYPPVGEPIIILKRMPEDKLVKKRIEFEEKGKKIEGKVEKFEEKAGEVEEEIKISDEKFLELEKSLHEKLKDLEIRIKEMDSLESVREKLQKEASQAEISAATVRRKSRETAEDIEKINSLLSASEREIENQLENIKTHEGMIEHLDKVKEKIENEITALEKEMKMIQILIKKPLGFAAITRLKKAFKGHGKRKKKIKKEKQIQKKKAKKIKGKVKILKKKVKKPKIEKKSEIKKVIKKHSKPKRKTKRRGRK
jgi:DNA repair exonuclease SbcCD ATPase subunit